MLQKKFLDVLIRVFDSKNISLLKEGLLKILTVLLNYFTICFNYLAG